MDKIKLMNKYNELTCYKKRVFSRYFFKKENPLALAARGFST